MDTRWIALLAAFTIIIASETGRVDGAILAGQGVGEFGMATTETFTGGYASSSAYDFGNGMKLASTANVNINHTINYGLGSAGSVNGGIDGIGTGFLSCNTLPQPLSIFFSPVG